jgi:hypothetical protein
VWGTALHFPHHENSCYCYTHFSWYNVCMPTTVQGFIPPGIDIPKNVGVYKTGFRAIQTSKRGFKPTLKRKNTPEWFYSEKKVRAFLKRRFPKFRTDPYQQHRAAMWYVLIREWFVMALSETEVIKRNSNLLFTDRRQVSRQVQMIRFAAKGWRTDGRKPTGRRRGRPTKERRGLIRASLLKAS